MLTGPRANDDGTLDWTCSKNDGIDHDVTVEVSGYSKTHIHFVRVMANDTDRPSQDAIWAINHVAGLKFEDADPIAAKAWAKDNFDKRASTSFFGSVNFELYAHAHPQVGEHVRMLIVTTEDGTPTRIKNRPKK